MKLIRKKDKKIKVEKMEKIMKELGIRMNDEKEKMKSLKEDSEDLRVDERGVINRSDIEERKKESIVKKIELE